MALAQYSDQYWFPDETLAVGVRYDVFPRFSPVHAPLFADQAGLAPIPNPGVADGAGLVTFFTQHGDYWIHIGGVTFDIVVDLDTSPVNVWPFTFRHAQAAPLAVWTIAHGLDAFPAVTVVDAANAELTGQVDYVDSDNLTITFGAPVSGVALLQR